MFKIKYDQQSNQPLKANMYLFKNKIIKETYNTVHMFYLHCNLHITEILLSSHILMKLKAL